jgi:beta-N-acetylhexosaminidase
MGGGRMTDGTDTAPHPSVALSRRSLLIGAGLGVATWLGGRIAGGDRHWRSWPLERQIAQRFLVGFPGTRIDPGHPIIRDIREHGIGGVVLYDRAGLNITGPRQLRTLTATLTALAPTPLFIATDQEGGRVVRLQESAGFPSTLSAQVLGEMDDLACTGRAADGLAHTLIEHGLNLNFAPVVDLNRYPDNPIIGRLQRSFAADPRQVARHAAAVVAAHRRRGVISTLKHFPGHGSSLGDSHDGFTDVTQTWRADELLPYRQLIERGLCDMIMTAHLFNARIDPTAPATLSRPTLQGLLRDQLGFRGVIVTDDLTMGAIARYYSYDTAVIRAMQAGADLLLIANHRPYIPDIVPQTLAIVRQAVDRGALSPADIRVSCRRLMALKARYRLAV